MKNLKISKKQVVHLRVENEYEKLKNIFASVDEEQLKLIDGCLVEAARLKVELDDLHEIVKECGLMKINPKNKLQQKELTSSKLLVKNRASYINYMAKLSTILGKRVVLDDEDEELDDYE